MSYVFVFVVARLVFCTGAILIVIVHCLDVVFIMSYDYYLRISTNKYNWYIYIYLCL